MLVLTETAIRAFSIKAKRWGLDVRARRLGSRHHPRQRPKTAVMMRLTIASATEAETVVCGTGKADIADSFLRALGAQAQAA